MKLLLDFFPIILFFVVFKVWGIYAATAVVGGVSILVQAVVGAWLPHYAEPVAETLAGLVSAVAFVGGALGVAYRPARGDIGE